MYDHRAAEERDRDELFQHRQSAKVSTNKYYLEVFDSFVRFQPLKGEEGMRASEEAFHIQEQRYLLDKDLYTNQLNPYGGEDVKAALAKEAQYQIRIGRRLDAMHYLLDNKLDADGWFRRHIQTQYGTDIALIDSGVSQRKIQATSPEECAFLRILVTPTHVECAQETR